MRVLGTASGKRWRQIQFKILTCIRHLQQATLTNEDSILSAGACVLNDQIIVRHSGYWTTSAELITVSTYNVTLPCHKSLSPDFESESRRDCTSLLK